jgi:hypothetical protein
MPSKGQKDTAQTRERLSAAQSRAHARRRERNRALALVAPRDLERLRRTGTVAPALQPLLDIAATESLELADALGGPEYLSAQQRLLIEDMAAVGIALRATLAAFLQQPGGDAELASKIGTLAATRRASVALLGLQRVARDIVEDLSPERLRAARTAAGIDFPTGGDSGAVSASGNAALANAGARDVPAVDQLAVGGAGAPEHNGRTGTCGYGGPR